MDEGGFYFTSILNEGRKLFLAQLTDDEAAAVGKSGSDSSGYFLYEKTEENPLEINVLARVDSDDAAFALSRLLNMK